MQLAKGLAPGKRRREARSHSESGERHVVSTNGRKNGGASEDKATLPSVLSTVAQKKFARHSATCSRSPRHHLLEEVEESRISLFRTGLFPREFKHGKVRKANIEDAKCKEACQTRLSNTFNGFDFHKFHEIRPTLHI